MVLFHNPIKKIYLRNVSFASMSHISVTINDYSVIIGHNALNKKNCVYKTKLVAAVKTKTRLQSFVTEKINSTSVNNKSCSIAYNHNFNLNIS